MRLVLALLFVFPAFAQLNCSGGCAGAIASICNIVPASVDVITASVVNTVETQFATTCVIPANTLSIGKVLKVSVGLQAQAPGTALGYVVNAGFGFTSSFANTLFTSLTITSIAAPRAWILSGLISGDYAGTATSVAMAADGYALQGFNTVSLPVTGVTTSGPLTFGVSITWNGNTAAYNIRLLSLRVE